MGTVYNNTRQQESRMELGTTNFQHEPSDIRIDGPVKPVTVRPCNFAAFDLTAGGLAGFITA